MVRASCLVPVDVCMIANPRQNSYESIWDSVTCLCMDTEKHGHITALTMYTHVYTYTHNMQNSMHNPVLGVGYT